MALDVFISFALSLGPSTCQLLARHQGSGGEPDPENGVQDTNGRYLFWMSLSFLVSGSMILVMVDVLSRWRSYYRAGCDLHSEWCDYIQHTSIPDRAKEVRIRAPCIFWGGRNHAWAARWDLTTWI